MQMTTLKTGRIGSIDLLRGAVMIIMALDHVRDYFHAGAFLYDPADLSQTTVFLFFTRWITHFCAPIFVLLAGCSAYLSGQRKTKPELASFLVKRGLWLILLELTLINFAWAFNLSFGFQLLGVIWALGIGMICLAGSLFIPRKMVLVIGLLLVAGHNLLDGIHVPGKGLLAVGWAILHDQKVFEYRSLFLFVGYPLIPWIGLILLGYCLGPIFSASYSPLQRKKLLLLLGMVCLAVFVLVRWINLYGNLQPWSNQSSPLLTFLSFISISKYPPSLDYLLVTVGIALLFLAWTEKLSGPVARAISVFGRVPFFYYLVHLYIIHVLALLAAVISGRPWTDMVSFNTWISYNPNLRGYGFNLGIVYLVWISIILILYPLCKRYDAYKTKHREKWWLSYL